MAVLDDVAVPVAGSLDAEASPAGQAPPAAVAIVMVVRDQAALTLRALVALARGEEGPAFETVVLDDASNDATPTLLANVEGHFTGLREDHARGFVAGADRAVAACQAGVVVLLREDLVVSTGWLESLIRSFDDPAVGAALPRVIDASGADVTDPGWPCLAIRRDALAQVGGFQAVAQPSRAVKATLLEALEASGFEIRGAPLSVLLALPGTITAS
ncbi:MAG: glycosyltransferase [Solirubrobacteraceae bacterium]